MENITSQCFQSCDQLQNQKLNIFFRSYLSLSIKHHNGINKVTKTVMPVQYHYHTTQCCAKTRIQKLILQTIITIIKNSQNQFSVRCANYIHCRIGLRHD